MMADFRNENQMSDDFSRAGMARVTDYQDNLLLFTPREYLTDVATKFGNTDCVESDVVVLDGEDGIEELTDVRIFQGNLVGALKNKIGSSRPMHLGRLRAVDNPKQTGKDAKPMWILEPPTDDDAQTARDYIATTKKNADPFA